MSPKGAQRPRVYLSPPHMGGGEMGFIKEAFETNWIAPLGPHVDGFERELCQYTGAPYAAALNSGTAALHLALILCGVERGDEVYCSTFTFAGSAYPIMYQGAQPVFIESQSCSWNLCPETLAEALADRLRRGRPPKALIVVHLYGQSADLDPILALCAEHGINVIEDAAESLGGTYKGRQTGTLGRFGVYSFNGNKIITTSGGGALVSGQAGAIERARFLSTQARDRAVHYEHSTVGYNYRMSNIAAALGRGQLQVLTERVAARRANFEYYQSALGAMPGLSFMPAAPWGGETRWLTCLTVDREVFGAGCEDIRRALEAQDIESRPLWKPMHLQPVFRGCPYYGNGLSERLFADGLCLPSGSSLTREDLERITGIFAEVKAGR